MSNEIKIDQNKYIEILEGQVAQMTVEMIRQQAVISQLTEKNDSEVDNG